MKRILLSILFLLFMSSFTVAAPVELNTYLDKELTNPSGFFKDGGVVHVTAYNGVSCCVETTITIRQQANPNNSIILIISDNNDGLYRGQFYIGTRETNDSADYIQVQDNESLLIFASLSPISNGTKNIYSEYTIPSAPDLSLVFDGGVILSWTESFDQSGIDRYILYRSDVYNDIGSSITSTTKTNYTDKDVNDGKVYYYSIRAVDSVGNIGNFSNVVSVETPDKTAPSEIRDLRAKSLAKGSIFINWTKPYDNKNVSYYILYRSKSFIENTISAEHIYNGSSLSYLDQKTEDGVKYYYAIEAVDSSENVAKISNIADATADATAPKKIEDLKAVVGKKGLVSITWSSDCNGCKFRIYRSRFEIKNSGDLSDVVPRETENSSYSEIVDGTVYYAIVAVDGVGNIGELSNVVRVDPDFTPPASVRGLGALADINKKINLTWDSSTSSDLSYYNIYRSETREFNFLTVYAISKESKYVDENVEREKQYFYVVRAVDSSDNEENNTEYSSVVAKDEIVILDVSYPINYTRLSQDRVSVLGRTDRGAFVRLKSILNGSTFETEAIVDKNGIFIGYIPLGNGNNLIEVYTQDSSGNTDKKSVVVINNFVHLSSDSIEESVNNLKLVIENDTITTTDEFMKELAKNDPNIIKERQNIENYISGSFVFGSSLNVLIVLIAAVSGIGVSIFSHRRLRREFDLAKIFFGRVLHEERKEKEKIRTERDYIKQTFQKHVDPVIVRKLLSGQKEQKTDVSVLLVDIRGFTNLFSKMKPDDVGIIMDKYIEKMVKSVRKNNGAVQKIVGDMVYAIFGVNGNSGHSKNAFQAALDMGEQLNSLNIELKKLGYSTIDVGIAISGGSVTLKSVGSDDSMLYFTAVGEPISVAVKLEEIAKPGEIIITEHIYKDVKEKVRVTKAMNVRIKGKTVPMKAYVVK